MPIQTSGADASIYQNIKGYNDYNEAAKAQGLQSALAAAQIGEALTKQREAQYLDVDKLGKQSIVKATMGLELSPEEQAAARYVSANSGGLVFDPATGNAVQKPTLESQLGLRFGGQQPALQSRTAPNYNAPQELELPIDTGEYGNDIINIPSEFDTTSDIQFGNEEAPEKPAGYVNQFDALFEKSYDAAAGNPKVQAQLLADYSKSKYNMTEPEAKAAGFADRMVLNEPILLKPEVVKALSDPFDKTLASIPLVGNYLSSDELQSGNQAQRDFINAVLRRESGAVISPEEFSNARQQYFPQPGDSEATLRQKAANRTATLGGIERGAGPAYQRVELPVAPDNQTAIPAKDKLVKGKIYTLPNGEKRAWNGKEFIR